MTKQLTALLLVGLAACGPLHLGSNVPTDNTYRLTSSELREAESADCEQTWVTGGSEDVSDAYLRLRERGVEIHHENPVALGTALKSDLYLSPDFQTAPALAQAQVLSHELVHYCDRDKVSDEVFDTDYLRSNRRWVFEVRAYAQSYRTRALQGEKPEHLVKRMRKRVEKMRDTYFLWDIDPEQYETETLRIWEAAIR